MHTIVWVDCVYIGKNIIKEIKITINDINLRLVNYVELASITGNQSNYNK